MNVLITGAGRGIGFAVAKQFLSFPDIKVYAISRNIKKLELLAISNGKGQIIPIEYNLMSLINGKKSIHDFLNCELDIIINNAGILLNKNFSEFSVDEITKIFNVNLIAPALLIKELFEKLNPHGAHIVNIGSMGGFQGSEKFPGLSFYSSSKAALASLTECLATDYKNTNHKFNCLALGAVQTEMLQEAFPGYLAPLTPDKMAEFIVDFSLNGQRFFNGKIIPVAQMNP